MPPAVSPSKPAFEISRVEGLTEEEAARRLAAEGPNELPSAKKRGPFAIVLEVIREPMFLLLIACGSLYLVLGDVREALLLLGFVFVVIAITFVQERKTERALDALRDLSSPRALVIRSGQKRRIAGREVAREDVLLLSEGDRVPADAVVLDCTSFSVVPIAGLSLVPVLLGWPLALLPIHIVFLELIIDPACTVIFEAEKDEVNVMKRPPRRLAEPIFGGRGMLLGLIQGLSVLVVDLALFAWALSAHGETTARALAFTTMVLGNLGMILLNRAGTRSLLATVRLPNPPQVWVTGGAFLFLALALSVPAVRALFGFAALSPELLGLAVAGVVASLTVANLARHVLAGAPAAP